MAFGKFPMKKLRIQWKKPLKPAFALLTQLQFTEMKPELATPLPTLQSPAMNYSLQQKCGMRIKDMNKHYKPSITAWKVRSEERRVGKECIGRRSLESYTTSKHRKRRKK